MALRLIDISGASEAQVVPGTLDPRGFKVLRVDAETGEPVRYGCDPIHYVINPASAPAGGIEDAHDAFETISDATGFRFVYDGTTTEEFSVEREAHQPDRYGDRWAPVLVTWSSQPLHYEDETGMRSAAVGLGGSMFEANEEGRPVYVTGVATFDSTNGLSSGRAGAWRHVMLHELSHVIGLDHVYQPGSVMNVGPEQRMSELGEGDRAGLWELGLGTGCVPTPDP